MVHEYTIAESHDIQLLINIVEDMLEAGWEPQGGVAIRDTGGTMYYQTMVRETT